jgi:hypothetical protein
MLNGNAGLVQIFGLDSYHNRNGHRDSLLHSAKFEGRADCSVREILSPNDRLTLFTQINYVPRDNFHPQDDDTGAINATVFGPWWRECPARLYSNPYCPTMLVPQIMAGETILDRPENKP